MGEHRDGKIPSEGTASGLRLCRAGLFSPAGGPSSSISRLWPQRLAPGQMWLRAEGKLGKGEGRGEMRTSRAPWGPGGSWWASCVSWSWAGAGAPFLVLSSWGPSCRGSYLW